jgi:glycine cleavage system H protein
MDRSTKSKHALPLIPPDAKPCVWMTAGVVAYKMCDRDFDCDHCPLDAGLCGRDYRLAAEADEARDGEERFEFPSNQFYLAEHTWARPVDRGRVRCGADAFAARLLSRANSIVLPAEGSVLHQGRVGIWISEDDRLVPLLVPVSGQVARCNRRAQASPGLVGSSPYDEGWLIEMNCPDWDSERERLLDAGGIRQLVQRQMTAFRKRVARYTDAPDPALGPTMADGGQPLSDVRRILGPERYRRLILRFLS